MMHERGVKGKIRALTGCSNIHFAMIMGLTARQSFAEAIDPIHCIALAFLTVDLIC